jgi:predicted RNase H-like nuclease (RuvC/YqgF family)
MTDYNLSALSADDQDTVRDLEESLKTWSEVPDRIDGAQRDLAAAQADGVAARAGIQRLVKKFFGVDPGAVTGLEIIRVAGTIVTLRIST